MVGNGNTNNLDYTTKYVQGSIWKWENPLETRRGVQAGNRPVVIISNNYYNNQSIIVNCATLTSVLKDSPVHISVYLHMDSHIQCEQIQTIPKSELVEYLGMVPFALLAHIKNKLRIQFDIEADDNTEMFNNISNSIDTLKRKIDSFTVLDKTIDTLSKKTEMLNIINRAVDTLDKKADIINKNFAEFTEKTAAIKDNTDLIYADVNIHNEKTNVLSENLRLLVEKADKGFGIQQVEDDMLKLMFNLYDSMENIEKWHERIDMAISVLNKNERDTTTNRIFKLLVDLYERIGKIETYMLMLASKSEAISFDKSGNQPFDVELSLPVIQNGELLLEQSEIPNIADMDIKSAQVCEAQGYSDFDESASGSAFGLEDTVSENEFYDTREKEENQVNVSASQNNENTVQVKKKQSKPRNYTDADKIYIADSGNSIESVMERYGYDRQRANTMRHYFKKQLGNSGNKGANTKTKDKNKNKNKVEPAAKDNNIDEASSKTPAVDSSKKAYRKYTAEDVKFILDKSNSLETLVSHFGYKNKTVASWARSKVKQGKLASKMLNKVSSRDNADADIVDI